jgi:D-aspartate ligase
VPYPNTLVPTSLSDVNEFAQTARFPLVVKAAAWLDPKLKVSIVRTERELIDVWHWVERSSNPNLLIQEYIPLERTGSSTATAMARRIAWPVSQE